MTDAQSTTQQNVSARARVRAIESVGDKIVDVYFAQGAVDPDFAAEQTPALAEQGAFNTPGFNLSMTVRSDVAEQYFPQGAKFRVVFVRDDS